MAEKTKKKTKKILIVGSGKTKVETETINSVRKFQGVQGSEKENRVSDKIKKIKIRVIGIGGGGGTIVSELALQIPKATFVVANTDLQALKITNRKVNRFQFGQSLTHGLGTGMSVDLGKEAAQNEKDKIRKLCQGQDLCIIIACLGGGAGSGAAPIFAKISKSLGNLTYGIFTLPFKFEGEKKMEIAKAALKRVKSYLNVITIIPNERIFQTIDKATPLGQALSVINKSLAKSLEGLIETIYEPGLINIDFADFKTIFEGRGGLAYLNTAEVPRKEDSTKDLMAQVLNSSLYPYTIRGVKGVLFNIAGEKNLSLSKVSQISKTISELVNPEAKIIFGISQNKKYSDVVKITLLAVGCGMKFFPSKQQKKRIIKKAKKAAGESPAIKEKPGLRRSSRQILTSDKEKQVVEPKTKKPEKFSEKGRSLTKLAKKIKREKIKIKIVKKPIVKESEKEVATGLPVQKLVDRANRGTEIKQTEATSPNQGMVRKSGLQIKKEAQELEKEILEKEKFWETPAFLRKKT